MSELTEEKLELARVTAGLTYREEGFPGLTYHISITDTARKGEKVSDAVDRVYGLVEKKLDQKIADQQNA